MSLDFSSYQSGTGNAAEGITFRWNGFDAFDDLLDEIERRGLGAEIGDSTATELINEIWQFRRLGKDYQRTLDQLIYQTIGKIV